MRPSAESVEHVFWLNAAQTLIPDAEVTVSRDTSYPPLPSNPATEALAARAETIYAELARKLTREGSGGAQ